MLHSLKPIFKVVLFVGIIGTVIIWFLDRIDMSIRLGITLPSVAALGLVVWPDRRKELLPDFLGSLAGKFFERRGFCFTILPAVDQGQAVFHLYFQNRLERGCRAQVVIKPSRQLWLNRPPIGDWTLVIDCEGGAFGVVVIPYVLQAEFQGKAQTFEVAAHVVYPDGRGGELRYKRGITVGYLKPEAWKIAYSVVFGVLGGNILLWKPARVSFRLPTGVDKQASHDVAPIRLETLWRPGDSIGPELMRLIANRAPAADPKAGLYELSPPGP